MKAMFWSILAAGAFAMTAQAANPVVVIETSLGNIKVELYEDKAPITVKNFLAYVDDKHYDNTIFHRVIDGFMIQAGGFGADKVEKKTKAPIKNEFKNGLSNERGTLAMARMSEPDTASAQFFINVNDNKALDIPRPQTGNAGYCVFGKVIEGMDVVDKIKAVKTTTSMLTSPQGKMPHQNVPEQDVVIKSIRKQ